MDALLKVAQLAPLITAMIAVIAAFFAWHQIRLNRQNEAKQQFLNLLDECVKHPLLAIGQIEHTLEARAAYHWFLSKLLMSSESILENFPSDIAWKNTIKRNLSAHVVNFETADIEKYCYSEALNRIIIEIEQGNVQAILSGKRS